MGGFRRHAHACDTAPPDRFRQDNLKEQPDRQNPRSELMRSNFLPAIDKSIRRTRRFADTMPR
jgi:hypothetical protein